MQSLRFGTWNVLYGRAPHPVVGGSIHECPAERLVAAEIGEDEAISRRYERIVEVLAETALDFLGIQELDDQLLQLIQSKTSFSLVCYSEASLVGLLQHRDCEAVVVSTHEYELGGRVMVGAVVQLQEQAVQLCCTHVNSQIRKDGPKAVAALATQAAQLRSECPGLDQCSWVVCADFNMGLDQPWIVQAWESAGGSVHCCGEFTVSRSDNRLDCFDGFVVLGECHLAKPQRELRGMMPKYLQPSESKPCGEPQLRFAESGCRLESGEEVAAGELLLWPTGSTAAVGVVPGSSAERGLSDHLMVVTELRSQ